MLRLHAVLVCVSSRQWLHRGEGAGELLQGIGDGPERSRSGEFRDQRLNPEILIPQGSMILSFCFFSRTLLTPHSEKR